MVSIDIEMPGVCDHCPFFDDNGDYPTCIVTQHSKGYNFRYREERMDDCPLLCIQSTTTSMTKEEAIEEIEEYLRDADKAISEDDEYIRGWKSALLVAMEIVHKLT